MTQLDSTGEFKLWFSFDRAAFTEAKKAGLEDRAALDLSLLCPSMASTYEVEGRGIWEFDMTCPAGDDLEYVVQLWPEKDEWWPDGEVNIIEGHAGQPGNPWMTNLHWKHRKYGHAEHAPMDINVDTSKPHRYKIDVQPTYLDWYVDGELVRHLETEYAPYNMKVHFVVQGGFNPIWWDRRKKAGNFDLHWDAAIKLKLLRVPGLDPHPDAEPKGFWGPLSSGFTSNGRTMLLKP